MTFLAGDGQPANVQQSLNEIKIIQTKQSEKIENLQKTLDNYFNLQQQLPENFNLSDFPFITPSTINSKKFFFK